MMTATETTTPARPVSRRALPFGSDPLAATALVAVLVAVGAAFHRYDIVGAVALAVFFTWSIRAYHRARAGTGTRVDRLVAVPLLVVATFAAVIFLAALFLETGSITPTGDLHLGAGTATHAVEVIPQ